MQKVSSDQEKNRHTLWKEMVLCNAYPQRHQRVWWYNRCEQSGNGSDWSPLWLFQSKRLDLLTSEHAVGWGLSTGLGNQSCVAPWDVACTLETCNSHNWHVPAGGAESLSSVRFAYNYLLKIVNSFPSIWERESSQSGAQSPTAIHGAVITCCRVIQTVVTSVCHLSFSTIMNKQCWGPIRITLRSFGARTCVWKGLLAGLRAKGAREGAEGDPILSPRAPFSSPCPAALSGRREELAMGPGSLRTSGTFRGEPGCRRGYSAGVVLGRTAAPFSAGEGAAGREKRCPE